MKLSYPTSILSIIALCFFTKFAQAGLIINGDFETGNLAGWNFVTDADAYSEQVAEVASFNGSNAFRMNTGSNRVGIEAGGTLTQSVFVTSGTKYQFSADLLAIQNHDGGDNVDGGTITASINGLDIHTFDIARINSGVTLLDSFIADYTASITGLVDVSFYFSRQYLNRQDPVIYHYLDNVNLATAIASVPEPASLSLMLLGLIILLFSRRKLTSHPDTSLA